MAGQKGADIMRYLPAVGTLAALLAYGVTAVMGYQRISDRVEHLEEFKKDTKDDLKEIKTDVKSVLMKLTAGVRP
jgi:hypothetical protein